MLGGALQGLQLLGVYLLKVPVATHMLLTATAAMCTVVNLSMASLQEEIFCVVAAVLFNGNECTKSNSACFLFT